MEKETKGDFQVGVFVFIGLMMVMISILFIGAEQTLWQRNYSLYVSFPDIYGLQQGAIVRLAGLEVGRVTKISFPKTLVKKNVIVRLTVNKKMQERIRTDSTASIRTLGVLGDKYIAITLGSENAVILRPGAFVVSEESYDIENTLHKGGTMIDNILEISKSLKKVTANLEKGRLIENLVEKSSSAFSRIDKIMAEIQKGQGFLHELVYARKGTSLFNISENLDQSTQNIKNITKKIDTGGGTLGSLVNDPSLYNSMIRLFGGKEREEILQNLIQYNIEKREHIKQSRD